MTYAVDVFETTPGSLKDSLDGLETELETRADTKNIRLIDVKKVGDKFQGVLIIDA